MKFNNASVLGLSLLVTLGAAQLYSAQEASAQACASKSCCTKKVVDVLDIKAFEAKAMTRVEDAGLFLREQASMRPEMVSTLTVSMVGVYAEKLPPAKLGLALESVMQTASTILTEQFPLPTIEGKPTEAQRQQCMITDLMLAGALTELAQKAGLAIRERLSAPTEAIGPGASSEVVLDPEAYGRLMKGAMEQVVRGAIFGLGSRITEIPADQLPSLAMIRREPGSYSYTLGEAPLGDVVPSAVAAPVKETK